MTTSSRESRPLHVVKTRFWGLAALIATGATAFAPKAGAQATATLTTLHTFTGPVGAGPEGALIQASDGSFYGTTYGGNSSSGNYGTVFHLTAAGTLTTLHIFSGGADGAYPYCALIPSSDGSFYGTTASGGANNDGTVFKLTPSGVLNVLHSFNGSDGSFPLALVQGSDGNLYGTTRFNGSNGDGTVYLITTAGNFTTLHQFNGGDGEDTENGLIQARDGYFYGTTAGGGLYNAGTVFQITPAGVLTTLYSFNTSDGSAPESALLQGSDGNFYGTTRLGGLYGDGTIFQLTPSGTLTTLHHFVSGDDGSNPDAGMIQASDGNFYGATNHGGANNVGAIYQLTRAGVLTSIFAFHGPDGEIPDTALLQASDGRLYGTTLGDQSSIHGTVFVLTVSPSLTSPATASATVGQPFTYQITATQTPTSFSASGLPAGLAVDAATGLISGTPTMVGNFSVGLFAKNAGGTGSAALTLSVSSVPIVTPPPSGSLIQAVNLLSPPSALTVLVGQTVNLYVSVDATAGGLAGVEFFASGADLGGSTQARDSKTWIPPAVGDYILQAVATDITGATATTHEPIHVVAAQTDVSAPVSSLLSGLDNRTFAQGATVQLVASATDANGAALQDVEFYADGVIIPQSGPALASAFSPGGPVRAKDAPSGGYFGASYSASKVGDALLTLVAKNSQGIAGVSAGVTIHTTAAPQGDVLSCAITTPSSSGRIFDNASTAATVSANEPGGAVSKVELFVNSTSVGSVSAEPFAFNIPPQAAGSYALSAIATDAQGLSKVSAPVIVAAVTPPNVSIAVKGSATAEEDGAKAKFLVSRDGTDLSADLTVDFKAKGTAKNGVDYGNIGSSIVIPAGAASVKLKIKPLDNSAVDGTRTVTIKILPSPTGDYAVGAAKKATVSILDND